MNLQQEYIKYMEVRVCFSLKLKKNFIILDIGCYLLRNM
jgi:hypothetical protein